MAKKKQQVLTIEQVAILVLAHVVEKYPARRPWTGTIRAIRRDLSGTDWLPMPSVEAVERARGTLDAVLETVRNTNFRFRFDSGKRALVAAEQRYNAALQVWCKHRDALDKPFNRASREHVLLVIMPSRLLCEKTIYDTIRTHEPSASTEDYLQKILAVLS